MKREVGGLLVKADESLAAARLLLDQGFVAFAASRTYYAMFYSAQSMILDLGHSYSKHSEVIGAFGREFAKTGKIDQKLHRYLIDSQDLRNVADYGIDDSLDSDQVKKMIQWAEEFIKDCRKYLAQIDR